MRIFVIGSSITSSYWNGAATYYRGIYKGLAALGHEITFAEPDIYSRQNHRDAVDLSYVDVVVYRTPKDIADVIARASSADVVIKHSGVGADDELLERLIIEEMSSSVMTVFWDVDAPATVARVEEDPRDPFRHLIPQYDLIFTYGGGPAVVQHYLRLGAITCHPIYNGLDPETHHHVLPDDRLRCDLAFIGHRLPDREKRVEEFFLRAAKSAPEMSFILGGEGWGDKSLPANVRWIGHVGTGDHNRINCSAKLVLNVNRDSMARVGYSPPTRVFEAAGAAVCLVTDAWRGVEEFFTPGSEILVARSAKEVVDLIRNVDLGQARHIGSAMQKRALRDHTYDLRAAEVDRILNASICGRQMRNAAESRVPVQG